MTADHLGHFGSRAVMERFGGAGSWRWGLALGDNRKNSSRLPLRVAGNIIRFPPVGAALWMTATLNPDI
jgi:hypothetical protein